MQDCLFCKIAKGEIPSQKIYEDEKVFVFLDINPVNKGHTLIIPKKHFANLYELPLEEINAIFNTAKKISIAIKESLNTDGINLGMNNDKAAGQIIFHAHVHVIPRFLSDGLKHWKGDKEYDKEELEEIAQKISEKII